MVCWALAGVCLMRLSPGSAPDEAPTMCRGTSTTPARLMPILAQPPYVADALILINMWECAKESRHC